MSRPALRKVPTPPPTPLPEEKTSVGEEPVWMHPYVLAAGGLLVLALGFLIGLLLR